jgi:hypothetical protein
MPAAAEATLGANAGGQVASRPIKDEGRGTGLALHCQLRGACGYFPFFV